MSLAFGGFLAAATEAASRVNLHALDYSIMALYCLFVIGIGFALKKQMKSSADFFLSGRSIPAWVTGLAFISANLGALEVMGMAAQGAKYGMLTTHFYWLGAIPAMVFLAIFMMPFYYGSKARSAPEYLKLRFDEKTRCLNSISFAFMTLLGSGISMHVLADTLRQLLGWEYNTSLWISSIVVLAYVLKGGLTSAIYTEVLQFFLIIFGFAPVVILGLKEVGGFSGLTEGLKQVGANSASLGLADKNLGEGAWLSIWSNMGSTDTNPMGIEWAGMVFGLGFVLSFGYWCTNFLVVQRAMAADSMKSARRTPIIAAVPKMVFPLLVIVPGLIAIVLHSQSEKFKYEIPGKEVKLEAAAWPAVKEALQQAAAIEGKDAIETRKAQTKILNKAVDATLDEVKVAKIVAAAKETGLPEAPEKQELVLTSLRNAGERDYNNVISSLVFKYCPTGLLGLALTALMASFMSGMAGNVTAFNTVWTYDIYQSYFGKNKSDDHYMWMGRVATTVGIVLSIGLAYVARQFNNVMDMAQLVFGFVNAPIFATFLMGMFWKRATGHGAFVGLLCGTMTSALFHGSTLVAGGTPGVKGGWLSALAGKEPVPFASEMAQNFWLATFAFSVGLIVTIVVSLATKQKKTDEELTGLVYSLTPKQKTSDEAWILRPAVAGTFLLIVAAALNLYFW